MFWRWIIGVGLIVSTSVGCGTSFSLSADEDSRRARKTLIEALDAWKSGQVRSLAKKMPPIRFVDDDQLAGLELLDYALDDDGIRVLPFQNIKVCMTVRDRRGQSAIRIAFYQVVLEPRLAVLRSDT